jgi:tetratricopeptide (TPR) repeat protein
MYTNTNCFVIIGYGKKPSYATGRLRELDLEETYSLLIKPVFDSLDIPCYRAIDKNLSGSIDKLMLQEIKDADIVLADISTLNANVMWELGVRHSLKPHHTIMICEREQMSSIPFDVNSFVIHQYTHSDQGIPYREVLRFKEYLTKVIKGILEQNPQQTDSPVFTFLDELRMKITKKNMIDKTNKTPSINSFVSIMDKAEKAKDSKDYEKALEFLATAKNYAINNMTLRDNLSFIISRQALCTYKSKKPNEQKALEAAKEILQELNPTQSQNIEVIGLSGAINKRLNEITYEVSYLDSAIQYYEKGFQLKQDYYNGINAAFMLYKKASILKSQNHEWEDVKLKADYIRNTVLEITAKLESQDDFLKVKDDIWVLLTIAEIYNYKHNEIKMQEYEQKAKEFAEKTDQSFALSSYQEQKDKIKNI